MSKLTKIVFVIENLNAGGAERVFRTLASEFDRSSFDVTLLLFNYENKVERKYPIPQNIKVVILNKSKKSALFALIKMIRELNPDIVMSTLAPVNILCLISKIILRNKKVKYIIRETTIKSTSIKNTKNGFFEKLAYKSLIKIFYNFADSIISLSKGAKKDLVINFGINEDKIKVIYNPLDINEIKSESLEEVDEFSLNDSKIKIVCVGSLVKSKGHTYLIQATEVLVKKYNFPIEVYFIGDGSLRDVLYDEVSTRGLLRNIHFMGFKTNPYKYVKNSDIFVLPALWEGFGNVIVEAMACNTPVIVSNCESGPKEIITNGVDGILVEPENIDSLADAIKNIIEDDKLRQEITINGCKRASEFDSEIIVKEYERHLISLFK